jgi:hypothetical protein
MVIQALRNNGITPVKTCAWSVKNNFRAKSQGTEFAYFVPQFAEYGIECEYTWDYGKALAALKDGKMVIGRAKAGLWTGSGHYILAYGLDGASILVNDPNSQAAARTKAPLATFKAQVTPFWIIKEEWRMQEDDVRRIFREEMQKKSTAPSEWAKDAWKWAQAVGSPAPICDGTNPQGYVTREQATTMMQRMWNDIKLLLKL